MELTREDWEIITEMGKLCNEDYELDLTNFRIMMQRQLASYVQVCICSWGLGFKVSGFGFRV